MIEAIEAHARRAGGAAPGGRIDSAVLRAMQDVPRDAFVPAGVRAMAFEDTALPIGHGQTISQPFIVALMTDLLGLGPSSRVLEVGTGSGYQAAVLSRLVDRVFTVEIVPELAARAADALKALGFDNVEVRAGDGSDGWPEAAPFDAVIVTAAAPRIPPALAAQLKAGGRLVIPLGEPGAAQSLTVAEKGPDGALAARAVLPVQFVPFTGAGGA